MRPSYTTSCIPTREENAHEHRTHALSAPKLGWHMMADEAKTTQKHPHPMPSWIAVVPLPDLDEAKNSTDGQPCPDCGLVHPPNMMAALFGINVEEAPFVKALVVEIGHGTETPFGVGSVVTFAKGRGTMIEDALFMLADNVVAWEE